MISGCSKNYGSTRKTEPPTIIQTAIKNRNAKKQATEEETAAITIQEASRSYNARKQVAEGETAAITIQAAGRGYNARKQATEEETAAITIQAASRSYNARKQVAEKETAAITIQAAGRRHQAEQILKQAKTAAITIQAAGRGSNTRKGAEAERRVAKAEKIEATKATTELNNVELTSQTVVRDHNLRAEETPKVDASGTEAISESSETSHTSDPSDDEDGMSNINDDHTQTTYVTCDEATMAPTAKPDPSIKKRIASESRLTSYSMHKYIKKELPDFKASEDTFSTGGATRPIFFYRENINHHKQRVYIALAHNKYPNDKEAHACGTRSLSEVLSDIKAHLSETGNHEMPTKLLILLQQVSKLHWTLLEINKNIDDSGAGTATHYDSKSYLSTGNLYDSCISEAKNRITSWMGTCFPTIKVAFNYYGTQSALDSCNCGRYALIKLRSLLNPKAGALSLKQINESLNGEEKTNTQETISKKKSILSGIKNTVKETAKGFKQ